jgi:hypothetical protein
MLSIVMPKLGQFADNLLPKATPEPPRMNAVPDQPLGLEPEFL